MEDLRWIVRVSYRGNLGVLDNEFHVEEFTELQEIIERGPDWNCIIDIVITLNPKRRAYDDTVEQAAER
jgi:hypothetical protein